MQNGRQKCCQLMRVMADHTKVIAILVIPWVAAFNVVDFLLQLDFSEMCIRDRYPQHLIVCFHGFGHTLGLFHLLNDKAAPFRCLFVQVSKVSMQFAG